MRVVVHSAAIQDRDGAELVLDKDTRALPLDRTDLADGGYSRTEQGPQRGNLAHSLVAGGVAGLRRKRTYADCWA
jgi:hypothetical protein